jgi:hypothetical protein
MQQEKVQTAEYMYLEQANSAQSIAPRLHMSVMQNNNSGRQVVLLICISDNNVLLLKQSNTPG